MGLGTCPTLLHGAKPLRCVLPGRRLRQGKDTGMHRLGHTHRFEWIDSVFATQMIAPTSQPLSQNGALLHQYAQAMRRHAGQKQGQKHPTVMRQFDGQNGSRQGDTDRTRENGSHTHQWPRPRSDAWQEMRQRHS